jgi:hypothetical protein
MESFVPLLWVGPGDHGGQQTYPRSKMLDFD